MGAAVAAGVGGGGQYHPLPRSSLCSAESRFARGLTGPHRFPLIKTTADLVSWWRHLPETKTLLDCGALRVRCKHSGGDNQGLLGVCGGKDPACGSQGPGSCRHVLRRFFQLSSFRRVPAGVGLQAKLATEACSLTRRWHAQLASRRKDWNSSLLPGAPLLIPTDLLRPL